MALGFDLRDAEAETNELTRGDMRYERGLEVMGCGVARGGGESSQRIRFLPMNKSPLQ